MAEQTGSVIGAGGGGGGGGRVAIGDSGMTTIRYEAPATTTVTATVDDDEPMVSIQSQLGLLVTAILTVLGFVFHKDLGDLAAPLGVIALAVYGAAVAIARAMKHRTVVTAKTAAQSINVGAVANAQQFADHTAVAQAFDQVQHAVRTLDSRVAAVEVTTPVTPKKTTTKKPTARKTTKPRR